MFQDYQDYSRLEQEVWSSCNNFRFTEYAFQVSFSWPYCGFSEISEVRRTCRNKSPSDIFLNKHTLSLDHLNKKLFTRTLFRYKERHFAEIQIVFIFSLQNWTSTITSIAEGALSINPKGTNHEGGGYHF